MRDVHELLGKTIAGHFLVHEQVGDTTYRGEHKGPGTALSIKCLEAGVPLDHDTAKPFLEKFREAMRPYAKASRDNSLFAKSIGSGMTATAKSQFVPFTVFEWAGGRSLADVIVEHRTSKKPPTPVEVVFMLAPLAGALGMLHADGLIHGSVTAEHVVLPGPGSSGPPKLLFVGVGPVLDAVSRESGSTTPRTTGRPAPEQVVSELGELGPPTDVFGLARIILELLGGTVIDGAVPEIDGAAIGAARPVLMKALTRTPRDRHATVSAFWDSFTAAASARGSEPPRARASVVPPRMPSIPPLPYAGPRVTPAASAPATAGASSTTAAMAAPAAAPAAAAGPAARSTPPPVMPLQAGAPARTVPARSGAMPPLPPSAKKTTGRKDAPPHSVENKFSEAVAARGSSPGHTPPSPGAAKLANIPTTTRLGMAPPPLPPPSAIASGSSGAPVESRDSSPNRPSPAFTTTRTMAAVVLPVPVPGSEKTGKPPALPATSGPALRPPPAKSSTSDLALTSEVAAKDTSKVPAVRPPEPRVAGDLARTAKGDAPADKSASTKSSGGATTADVAGKRDGKASTAKPSTQKTPAPGKPAAVNGTAGASTASTISTAAKTAASPAVAAAARPSASDPTAHGVAWTPWRHMLTLAVLSFFTVFVLGMLIARR